MIIAKQVPPEYQESPLSNGEDFPEDIAVIGNPNFKEHIPPLFARVRRALRCDELPSAIYSYGATSDHRSPKEIVNEYLPCEKGEYSDHDIDSLWELVQDYDYCLNKDQRAILCEILSIVAKEPWKFTTIQGSSQSDWQEVYYPSNAWDNDDRLWEFEAQYFNEGSEWKVGNLYVYVTATDPDDIKAQIAAAVGCEPDEVKLLAFNGWKKTAKYKAVG